MKHSASTFVQWNGDESISIVRDLLEKHHPVTLGLPPETHHALFSHLESQRAQSYQPEVLSRKGDGNLLHQIAKISGLEDISGLAKPALGHGAKVEVISPPPSIVFDFEH